jgi:hypothetical protein
MARARSKEGRSRIGTNWYPATGGTVKSLTRLSKLGLSIRSAPPINHGSRGVSRHVFSRLEEPTANRVLAIQVPVTDSWMERGKDAAQGACSFGTGIKLEAAATVIFGKDWPAFDDREKLPRLV